jgi:lipid A 3-O-deacylase
VGLLFFSYLKEKEIHKVSVQVSHLVVFFYMKFKALLLLFTFLWNVNLVNADEGNKDISFYTGTFDLLDKEGDDQTTLFGIEHKNPNLFRDTFLGKFKPVTGAFMTGKSSVYLYTGIEGQYGIGPLKILPSFAPGYYEKGDGKDLGDVLEFKSEIKLSLDIFENSKLGYSYSHISNNDWGATNPGTDNQQITFSKNF